MLIGETRVLAQPPKKDMGVEKRPHSRFPASTSQSSAAKAGEMTSPFTTTVPKSSCWG